MKQSSTPNPFVTSIFLPSARLALNVSLGLAAAALVAAPGIVRAQDAAPAAAPAGATQSDAQAAPDSAQPAAAQGSMAISNEKQGKQPRAAKPRKQDEKVVQSKDSKKADKKNAKTISLTGKDTKLPDKALYDKAQDAIKHGRYDVGRIDLQTLLNTYPESQYMMQSKLAIADSWYKEGGTAALTQAEQEYKDFITFFPNAPEAAEAQMRVGDIYFRQMDKPDRDYTKTQQAEAEYRLMLQQFPDSVLIPQAKEKLREVQEVMAQREAGVADFYATRQNASAAIARYQTIVDTYPLYSKMDDVLIAIGDQYEAMAHNIRLNTPTCQPSHPVQRCLPEEAKGRLLKVYDDNAQEAYDKVVLEHAASPHVEDAKDRLVGMNLPVPTPTAEEVAASTKLEESRGTYTLSRRTIALFTHSADTVPAATIGEPLLEDPKVTVAPDVARKTQQQVMDALNPGAAKRAVAPADSATPAATDVSAAQPTAAPAASTAPLALENVPTATAGEGQSSVVDSSVSTASPASTPSGGTGVGMEIVQPSGNRQAPTKPGNTAFPGTQPADSAPEQAQPAAAQPNAQTARPNPADNGGLTPSGPPAATQLAPVEHADKAPDTVNEVEPGTQPKQTQTADNGKKKPKPAYDSDQESSSKHKPKKGLKKLNPF